MWSTRRAGLARVSPLALGLLMLAGNALAQDMEPRRWSHLPMGLNIVGLGVAGMDGEIFLDPVLRIEDGKFDLYIAGASYMRTFEWLGRSSRVDFNLPWGNGRWDGLVDGVPTTVRRDGPMDPWVRLSMNLWGAPPLSGQQFAEYRGSHPVTTTVGAAVSLQMPWGEYLENRLINLGNNRWVARTQLGVLHSRGPWQLELTGTVSVYGDNDEFYGGTKLEQDPLGWMQAHVIRGFSKGKWASVSGGYTFAGETAINGVDKDNEEGSSYFSVAWGFPVGPRQALKVSWISSRTQQETGRDSDSLTLAWSTNWTN